MPRDSGGVYSLPSGNPVVTGTVIESSWANTTMDDITVALTDSLSRTGSGGMLVAIKESNGTVSNPSYTFTNSPTYGMWLSATDDELNFSAGATKVIGVKTAGVTITGTLGVSGAATLPNITGPTEVTGETTITGDVIVTGSLTVGGVLADVFPSGTKLIFPQAAAPTGWTIETGMEGRGIRLDDSSGGGTAGTSEAFSGGHTHSTPNHTHTDNFAAAGTSLSIAQMAAHSHLGGLGITAFPGRYGGGVGPVASALASTAYLGTTTDGNLTSTVGSGATHTHTITGAVSSSGASTSGSFVPKYVNALNCSKD